METELRKAFPNKDDKLIESVLKIISEVNKQVSTLNVTINLKKIGKI